MESFNIEVSIEYKKMAEAFFRRRNMEQAQYFANKAFTLNQMLDGVCDLAVALDVIVCAEKQVKAAGTGVQKNSKEFNRKLIGLQPDCDYDMTRSLFKKLVYSVHPDRNRSVAALTAFTIVNEAWSHLRNRKTPKEEETSLNTAVRNDFHVPPAQEGTTFSTVCSHCSTQLEYSVDFCKKYVRCIQCRGHFLAVEIPKPPPLCDQNAAGITSTVRRMGFSSVVPLVKTAPAGKNVVKDRREWKRKFGKQGSDATKQRKIQTTDQNKASISVSDNSPTPLTNQRNPLRNGNGNVIGHPEDVYGVSKQAKDILPILKPACAQGTLSGSKSDNNLIKALPRLEAERVKQVVHQVNPILTMPTEQIMSIPDQDFHDFNKDRTGSAFDVNQVWATYDHEDGMPRLYAQIHYVISQNPLNMMISWLSPYSNRDFSSANLTDSSIPKIAAGGFRAGKPEANPDLKSFSHKVMWMRDFKENILIYPRKGEVWALYRNWSPSRNASTPKQVVKEYSFVEVLELFTAKPRVRVHPLAKVPGFNSIFRRICDEKQIKTIPNEEIARFSHHAPAHWLKGDEGRNTPRDCWYIDPVACPSELLRVIPISDSTEENDKFSEVAMDNGSKVIKLDECNIYSRGH